MRNIAIGTGTFGRVRVNVVALHLYSPQLARRPCAAGYLGSLLLCITHRWCTLLLQFRSTLAPREGRVTPSTDFVRLTKPPNMPCGRLSSPVQMFEDRVTFRF